MANLTDKQRVFIQEYLSCWNATEAARRAGYQGDDNTLGVVGFENLRKPKIKEQIAARLQEKMMGADEALVRMAQIARGEWAEYFDDKGRVKIDEMVADGKGHLIKCITPTNNGKKIEFWDMQGALGTVLKHHGELKEIQDITFHVVYDE